MKLRMEQQKMLFVLKMNNLTSTNSLVLKNKNTKFIGQSSTIEIIQVVQGTWKVLKIWEINTQDKYVIIQSQ